MMGTPAYMSPEQCMGEDLDGRSDIYSLGVVLFEMLCGVVPFNSPTVTAVIMQHVQQEPPPMRVLNASISPAVEAVVLRALAKRREDRQQSARRWPTNSPPPCPAPGRPPWASRYPPSHKASPHSPWSKHQRLRHQGLPLLLFRTFAQRVADLPLFSSVYSSPRQSLRFGYASNDLCQLLSPRLERQATRE